MVSFSFLPLSPAKALLGQVEPPHELPSDVRARGFPAIRHRYGGLDWKRLSVEDHSLYRQLKSPAHPILAESPA